MRSLRKNTKKAEPAAAATASGCQRSLRLLSPAVAEVDPAVGTPCEPPRVAKVCLTES